MLRRLARAPGARRATCSHRAASLSTASSPAQADARSFELGDSVDRWRAWAPPQPSPSELLRGARRVLQNDAQYWLHSAARTAFYATHAVAGLAISGRLGEHPLTSERGAKAASSVFRLFAEAFVTFEQDHENIVDGVYSRPWDADFRHRQFSPSRVLDRGASHRTALHMHCALSISLASHTIFTKKIRFAILGGGVVHAAPPRRRPNGRRVAEVQPVPEIVRWSFGCCDVCMFAPLT